MKVLITGAFGNIGSMLMDELLRRGHEVTAFDLVGYPNSAGGHDNVATVLAELGDQLDPEQLAFAATLSSTPWSQRLGDLLDLVGHARLTDPLAAYVGVHANETTSLVTNAIATGNRNDRWKLRVNAAVEPDLEGFEPGHPLHSPGRIRCFHPGIRRRRRRADEMGP